MRRLVLGLTLALAAPQAIGAQATGIRHDQGPPPELPAAVASALASGGLRFVVSSAPLEFWFVKALPIAGGEKPPAWSGVEEGSLVGAVRVGADFRDVRGRIIKAGVYTLRYGIQPENGDHLGVSPYREFLLLVPAALDTDPGPRGHEGTVDLSKRTVGGSHPAVWSIDPPSTTGPVGSRIRNEDLNLESFAMEVPVARGGAAAGSLRFGLVLVGRIEA